MFPKYVDAFFYSLMVGAGEAFFAAYALHLGHSELKAGILATAPIVIGGLLQMLAPFGINAIQSFEKWTLTGVLFQSLIFILLIIFGQIIGQNFYLLFCIVTLYWSLALAISPSWNSWISSLLKPEEIRSFFSNRNIIISFGTLSGLCFSGLILNYLGPTLFGYDKFAIIFLFCFLFRFISFLSLLKHDKVEFIKIQGLSIKLGKLGLENESNFVFKFIVFSSLIKVGVFFSASFFSPYMLKQLKFDYIQYMLILVSSFSGRVILGQLIRKYVHKFDINLVYLISSIGICFIPIIWTFSSNFNYIFILEIFTGLLWGAFEIAFLVTCFEEIPSEQQAQFMTWYNLLHTLCIGIGCVAGISTFYFMENSIHTYYVIFVVSGILRLSSILFFPRKKIINGKTIVSTFVKTLAVRPNMGIIGRPMWQIFNKVKSRNRPD